MSNSDDVLTELELKLSGSTMELLKANGCKIADDGTHAVFGDRVMVSIFPAPKGSPEWLLRFWIHRPNGRGFTCRGRLDGLLQQDDEEDDYE